MRLLFLLLFLLGLTACTHMKNQSDASTDSIVEDSNPITNEDFKKSYVIVSTEFGTKTSVVVKDGVRTITTNALPNHSTGQFPNAGNPNTISAQERIYELPVEPVFTGSPKWARKPGVALNGVKFEPETAERFVCETGEVYRIEAFQNLVDLGLDNNHAHVQPTGAYHYHGVPVGLVGVLKDTNDIVLVGFAKDGFPIYYSKRGVYKPSFQMSEKTRTGDACSFQTPHLKMDDDFEGTRPDGTFVSDWEYKKGLGELDECNGITLDGEYVYFVTDEYPYVGRCLKGEFKEDHPQGPPPGGRPRNGDHPHGPGGHGH